MTFKDAQLKSQECELNYSFYGDKWEVNLILWLQVAKQFSNRFGCGLM